MSARHRRLETIGPWAAGLLLALPTLIAFYPPMSDLPYHEAAIGILRHFHDAARIPRGLYRLNLGEPNQLFHVVGWALSYVVSTRWAVKLLVAATVVAIPVSAARVARHVGSCPLAALVVAPIAVGWLFYWGLIANLIGLAALLAVLPGLDRFARAPTGRGAAVVCSAVLLVYFAHEAMMFLYAAAALGLAALYPWSKGKTSLRLLPAVLSVIITVVQAKWQQRFMSAVVAAMPRLWTSLEEKLENIPHIISPSSDKPVLWVMSILSAMTIAGLFWLRFYERRRTSPSGASSPGTSLERARSWALAYRWELFAATCMTAYFVSPLTLMGSTFVYHRWFPPGFAVLAVIAAPRDLFVRRARGALLAVASFPLATLFMVWPWFVDSNRTYMALEPLIGMVDEGSAVAALDLGPGDASRPYSLGTTGGRILATRGGRLIYAFTDSPISPAVLSRRYAWNESLVRVGFDAFAFRPAQDLYRFRYVLVRANSRSVAFLTIRSLIDEAEFVSQSEEWILFRSRVPTVPVLSHDFWLDGPPPPTLREQFNAFMASDREAEKLGQSAQGPLDAAAPRP